jgi:hypothetical protein
MNSKIYAGIGGSRARRPGAGSAEFAKESYMNGKSRMVRVVSAAAMSGLLAGAGAALVGCHSNSAGAQGSTSSMDMTAKHDCKGQNACKGQGGCMTGDNGCKGKNSCKGKGGCSSDHK